MVMGGISPDLGLVEMIELPTAKHPYFIACQFHPEFKSRPHAAHPLFARFAKAGLARRDARLGRAVEKEADGRDDTGKHLVH